MKASTKLLILSTVFSVPVVGVALLLLLGAKLTNTQLLGWWCLAAINFVIWVSFAAQRGVEE